MDKLRWTVPQICEMEVKMTESTWNKVGSQSDGYTTETDGLVIGSVVPSP